MRRQVHRYMMTTMSDSSGSPDLSSTDDLVTIAEVDSQPEFFVVRSLLESAGIGCYSPNVAEYYVKGKHASHSVILIQVQATQVEDAIALLKEAEAHPIPDSLEDGNGQ